MLTTPPPWMIRWKSLMGALLAFKKNVFIMMMSAVRLGMLSRNQMIRAVPPEMECEIDQATCEHPRFRRYGNHAGRFAQCLRCERKWKWHQANETWYDFPGSASSSTRSLPLPCPSSTTAAPKYRPKCKAAPKASQARASPTLTPQQENLLRSVLEMSYQDVAPGMTAEEQQLMRRDIQENMGYYVREHLADLQRLTQSSETASQLLSQIPTEAEDEEDIYDWATVEESQEL
eukprot:s697_g6.t1